MKTFHLYDVCLSDDDAATMQHLLTRQWYTCAPCFGTGWKNYQDFRSNAELKGRIKCETCDGLGVVQAKAS